METTSNSWEKMFPSHISGPRREKMGVWGEVANILYSVGEMKPPKFLSEGEGGIISRKKTTGK